jgi:hypothetical protein
VLFGCRSRGCFSRPNDRPRRSCWAVGSRYRHGERPAARHCFSLRCEGQAARRFAGHSERYRRGSQSLGSTGSLSSARTAKTHSCTR